jgi:nitrite reductase (NADH) small subunit
LASEDQCFKAVIALFADVFEDRHSPFMIYEHTMPFSKIAAESELPLPGEAKEFEVAGKTICVANVNGTVCAIDNLCLHMGGPLGQGYVDGSKIVCPWHGWEYDAATGQLFDDPKSKLQVYPIKIQGGEVLVDI